METKSKLVQLYQTKQIFRQTVIRNKEGHYIIKGAIQQEDQKFVNIYTSNIGAPEYTKQILTDINGEKRQQYHDTSLFSMDRLSRQKVNKESQP